MAATATTPPGGHGRGITGRGIAGGSSDQSNDDHVPTTTTTTTNTARRIPIRTVVQRQMPLVSDSDDDLFLPVDPSSSRRGESGLERSCCQLYTTPTDDSQLLLTASGGGAPPGTTRSTSPSSSTLSTTPPPVLAACGGGVAGGLGPAYASAPNVSVLYGSTSSIVDGLLLEIYDRWHYGPGAGRGDSLDSDTFTECSSTSGYGGYFYGGRHNSDSGGHLELLVGQRQSTRLNKVFLEGQDVDELREMRAELQHRNTQASQRLVRELKRRERRMAKVNKNCDIITAVLQASSLKRRVDAKMKFSIEPLPGDEAFIQWKDAMKAVARLPLGIPSHFRRTVWLSLADQHIASLKIDWEKTKKFAFNERSNPDDNKLGMQIVKDLHRTGCSGFSGQDNEEERAVLKRVLLAYARWNKNVGYCQGFNVLAALILDVVQKKEDDALKVMILLVDYVLPSSYFANNLRALSVDMAVFRDLLHMTLPQLSTHLDNLQLAARDNSSGANYEPPLTNVFTMQWFLTLFATCLPQQTALRVWDSVLLEGSEILLRTALAIWGRLQDRMLAVQSADEFYTTMGTLTQEMLENEIVDADQLIKMIYGMAPFPFPQLVELREKYTYNITPFSAAMSTGGQRSKKGVTSIFSDDDEADEDELLENINCFTGIFPNPQLSSPNKSKNLSEADRSSSTYDISKVSPGAYAANPEAFNMATSAFAERMTMDLSQLKNQYRKVRERQKQAHIILAAASAKHHANVKARSMAVAPIETPSALNHLFIGRSKDVQAKSSGKNRTIADAPSIAPLFAETPLYNKANVVSKAIQKKPENHGVLHENDKSRSFKAVPVALDSKAQKDSFVNRTISVDSELSTDTITNRLTSESDQSTKDGDIQEPQLVVPDVNSKEFSSERSSNGTDINDNQKVSVDEVDMSSEASSLASTPSKTSTQDGRLDKPEKENVDSYNAISDKSSNQLKTSTSITRKTEDALSSEYVATLTYKSQKVNKVPSSMASETVEEMPPKEATQSKVFNPFPSQHMSRRRAQNGIKLGLYSANNMPKLETGMVKGSGQKQFTRTQINTCLHRQYMADVKQQGSKNNGKR